MRFKLHNMEETAKNLNRLINIYGFGCEFSAEELFTRFNNANKLLDSLIKNGLVEKDPLSNNYYLSDIFTCNNFLTEHLKEDRDKEKTEIKSFEYEYAIKKEEFADFSSRFMGFEDIIRKIEIEFEGDEFKILVKLKADANMLEKFKRHFQ